jgi:isocitrate/isopropylmalate dehydrogenase
MMVRHLGEEKAAQHLERTVIYLLDQGDILTPDLGGTATTEQVGHAVIKALEA